MSEPMIARAAREIADGEWVLLGSPLAAAVYAHAQARHAPTAIALEVDGAARCGDRLLWQGDSLAVLGLLAQGRVDVALIDAARVDTYGNVNHSYVGFYHQPEERLPGAGIRTDALSLARRVVVLLADDTALEREVSYLTAPGAGSGEGWRDSAGLPTWAKGVCTILTPSTTYRADGSSLLEPTADG